MTGIEEEVLAEFFDQLANEDSVSSEVATKLRETFADGRTPTAEEVVQLLQPENKADDE